VGSENHLIEKEKKRDRLMRLWMQRQRDELKIITQEEERLVYFYETVLPELDKLEKMEQRTWDEHRHDFDLDILERGNENEDDVIAIPKRLVEACGKPDWEDRIFLKDPKYIHHLVSGRALCCFLKECTTRQKELLFYMDVYNVDGTKIAKAEGVNPRNITSVHARAIGHIRTHMLPLILLNFKLERCPKWKQTARDMFLYTIYEERFFCATMGKKYLKHWKHSYFKDGLHFSLTPITEYYNAEPKRKILVDKKWVEPTHKHKKSKK
jgi:hypothetical protein